MGGLLPLLTMWPWGGPPKASGLLLDLLKPDRCFANVRQDHETGLQPRWDLGARHPYLPLSPLPIGVKDVGDL